MPVFRKYLHWLRFKWWFMPKFCNRFLKIYETNEIFTQLNANIQIELFSANTQLIMQLNLIPISRVPEGQNSEGSDFEKKKPPQYSLIVLQKSTFSIFHFCSIPV